MTEFMKYEMNRDIPKEIEEWNKLCMESINSIKSPFSLKNYTIQKHQNKKLDYSEGGNIKLFPYKEYKKYVSYNVKDTLIQYEIEDAIKVKERRRIINMIKSIAAVVVLLLLLVICYALGFKMGQMGKAKWVSEGLIPIILILAAITLYFAFQ